MNFIRNKKLTIGIIVGLMVLVVVVLAAGNFEMVGQHEGTDKESLIDADTAIELTEGIYEVELSANEGEDLENGMTESESNETSKSKKTEKIENTANHSQIATLPNGKPAPIDPNKVQISKVAHTCTLSVRCDTILANDKFTESDKFILVPKNGVIYAEKTVTFYEGETVFNLLSREMKRNKIHMEFENPPMYNSAYLEGIGNLYEFDFGDLSGWMYKVNDWFPNYGSSRYMLQEGDKVEWVYTCDLGKDVNGQYSARNGR